MTGARTRPFSFERLPRVSRADVRAARLMGKTLNVARLGEVAREVAAALDVGARATFVGVRPAVAVAADLGAAEVVLSFARGAGGAAQVVLEPTLAVELVSRLLRSEEIVAPRNLTRVERGLLGYLVLLALRALPGWRFVGIGAAPHADAPTAEIEVVLGQGAVHRAWVAADAATLLALPAPPPRWDRLARLTHIGLDLPLVAATARLTVPEIRSLRPRDVLVVDAPCVPRLGVGRGSIELTICDDGFRVIGRYQRLESAMGETMNDKRDLLEDVPVELAAEIGRLRLSGKELLELEPGDVLPFGRPTAAPVDVTCGGRVVARGELVDIEGERGVRLSEVLG